MSARFRVSYVYACYQQDRLLTRLWWPEPVDSDTARATLRAYAASSLASGGCRGTLNLRHAPLPAAEVSKWLEAA